MERPEQSRQWSDQSIVRDALFSSAATSCALEASAPSATWRQIIDAHRKDVISKANKAHRHEASSIQCLERSTKIVFSTHDLAIEAVEDTVNGRRFCYAADFFACAPQRIQSLRDSLVQL